MALLCIATEVRSQAHRLVLPTQHESTVVCTAVHPGRQLLATGDIDGIIKIWETRTGFLLFTLIGHEKYITSLRFSTDGRKLLSTAFDPHPRLWNLDTGTPELVIVGTPGNHRYAKAIFLKADREIATLGFDKRAQRWDARSGLLLQEYSSSDVISVNLLSYESTLKNEYELLYAEPLDLLIASSSDSLIHIWELNSGVLKNLTVHRNKVTGLCLDSSGRTLFSTSIDSSLVKINLANFRKLDGLKFDFPVYGLHYLPATHEIIPNFHLPILAVMHADTLNPGPKTLRLPAALKTISSDPSGKLLALTLDSGLIKYLGNEAGQLQSLTSLNTQAAISAVDVLSTANTLIIHPENNRGMLLNGKTGWEIRRLGEQLNNQPLYPLGAIESIELSQYTNSGEIQQWNLASGLQSQTIGIPGASFQYLAGWGGSHTLMATAADSEVVWFSPATAPPPASVKLPARISALAASKKEKLLFAGTVKGELFLINTATREAERISTELEFPVSRVYTGHQGSFIAINRLGLGWYRFGGTEKIRFLKSYTRTNSPNQFRHAGFSTTAQYCFYLQNDSLQIINRLGQTLPMPNYHRIQPLLDCRIDDALHEVLLLYADGTLSSWKIGEANTKTIYRYDRTLSNSAGYQLIENRPVQNNTSQPRIWYSPDRKLLCTVSDSFRFYYNRPPVATATLAADNWYFSGTDSIALVSDRTYSVYRLSAEPKLIYQLISFGASKNLVLLPSGQYSSDPDVARRLHYLDSKNRILSFDQLDIRNNRPDKVLAALGQSNQHQISLHQKAFAKRISRLGLDSNQLKGNLEVPQCEIQHAADYPQEINQENLPIQITAVSGNYPVNRINVFINEVPLWGTRGRPFRIAAGKQKDSSIQIRLSAGTNKVEVSVMNSAGLESFRYPLYINYSPVNPIEERVYFIGIATDRFADAAHNLNYCAKDIRDLLAAFKNKFGPHLHVDTLINERVSSAAVAALKEKLQQTAINDKIIIAFSGHGLLDKQLNYYLSTYRVNFEQPNIQGLPYEALEELLNGVPARKKLLLLDACHSGEVDKEAARQLQKAGSKINNPAISFGEKGIVAPGKQAKAGTLQNSFELMQRLFADVGRNTGAVILAAAGGMQFALERGDLSNGVFTYSILELLRTKKTIDTRDFQQQVKERVLQLTNGLQQPNTRENILLADWIIW